jgi:hypothetical protein
MPRNDRECARRQLQQELRSANFTAEEAGSIVQIIFMSPHFTAYDVSIVADLVSTAKARAFNPYVDASIGIKDIVELRNRFPDYRL